MNSIQSIILGIIQGLTEFLPVSSSGHLNIFPWLLNWQEIPESFDLALHAGTLLAIIVYFFKDWLSLISGGCKLVFKKQKSTEGKMFWYIIAATIPAGVLGLILEKGVELITKGNLNTEMIIISVALIVMGVILYITDKKAKAEISYENADFKRTFLVGVSQALAAAVPGVSRSGITMTVARALKIERPSAAKLSFMLSAPIVAAAVILKLSEFELTLPFVLGILASFISGVLVIKFLMGFLNKGSFKVFAIYRMFIGIVIIAAVIIRAVQA